MKHLSKLVLTLIAGAMSLSVKSALALPDYTTAYTGTPLIDINNSGTILGGYGSLWFTWNGNSGAGSSMSYLLAPPGATSDPYSFNYKGLSDTNETVGGYRSAALNHWVGFVRTGNSFVTIDVPGAEWTEAHGISSNGRFVSGWFGDATVAMGGFLLDRATGALTKIAPPNANVMLGDVRNDGTVVGNLSELVGGVPRFTGFSFKDGVYSEFHAPGDDVGLGLLGISETGLLTGYFGPNVYSATGFIARGSDVKRFSSDMLIYAINDAGVAVGSNAFDSFGFILTPAPVPEPTVAVLMLVGLGVLTIRRIRLH